MVRGRFRLSVAAAGRTLATGRPADLPKRATSTSPERGDISRRTTHGIDTQGPGIFLAQFAGDAAPFNSWDAISDWAGSLGYKGVQIPTWDGAAVRPRQGGRVEDLLRRGEGHRRAQHGVEITELSHPSAGPARRRAPGLRRGLRRLRAAGRCTASPKARQKWAVEQMMLAAKASQQSRADAHGHLLRRAGLALSLSLAAAPGRA